MLFLIMRFWFIFIAFADFHLIEGCFYNKYTILCCGLLIKFILILVNVQFCLDCESGYTEPAADRGPTRPGIGGKGLGAGRGGGAAMAPSNSVTLGKGGGGGVFDSFS